MTDQSVDTPTQGLVLSPKLYNKVKASALIVLPAFASLYFALGSIWGLPNVEQVVGSITVFDTFLGSIVGLSSRTYNNSSARFDGHISIIDHPDGPKQYILELDSDPEDIDQKKSVTFRVGTPLPPPGA